LSDEKIEPHEGIVAWANAPGMYLCMARDVSFYEHGLFGISNPIDLIGEEASYPVGQMVPTAPVATSLATTKPDPPRQDQSSAGGRPATKHGDAIAALTIKLSALPQEAFGRYTAAALAVELSAEYHRLNQTPPSLPNCEKYAAGILRVLRSHRA
jgi:hypothetical protein